MSSKAKPAVNGERPASAQDAAAVIAAAKTKGGTTIKGAPSPKPAAPGLAAAAEAAKAPVERVPLNRLLISILNVRKSNRDEDIEGLADSIHARGLLQNLVVSASRGGREGLYEVDAGGRRLKALELLVRRGHLPRDWPVPVQVVDRADAREASLAENTQTVAMTPADEAEAYRDVIASYADDDSWTGAGDANPAAARVQRCAQRFGKSERHVQQRLQLVELHPEIFDELRDCGISLDVARAYASVPDQELQLKVWREENKRCPGGPQDVRRVRDALAGKVYDVDHKAVRYIGLDAYIAAGGRIGTDLFFGAGDRAQLLDPSIVDRLVREKAEAEATDRAAAEGFGAGLVRPWTGADWVDPKGVPEGTHKRYGDPAAIPADRRAATTVAFELREGEDGAVSLQPPEHQRYYWVQSEPAPPQMRQPANAYAGPTEEELEAAHRAEMILLRAARLAVPSFAGTAFEGRAIWPLVDEIDDSWLPPIERRDGATYVALIIRVDDADVEAAQAEAEARYDREQAELAEEEAAINDEAAAADADPAPEPRPEPVQ